MAHAFTLLNHLCHVVAGEKNILLRGGLPQEWLAHVVVYLRNALIKFTGNEQLG
jgi:hypothetical protein